MSELNKLYDKEKIMSMIISLNPTGTMNFSGTFQPNGTNNILKSSQQMSKDNLQKIQENQYVCDTSSTQVIENFENKSDKNSFIIIILIIILIIFLIFLLFKKKILFINIK